MPLCLGSLVKGKLDLVGNALLDLGVFYLIYNLQTFPNKPFTDLPISPDSAKSLQEGSPARQGLIDKERDPRIAVSRPIVMGPHKGLIAGDKYINWPHVSELIWIGDIHLDVCFAKELTNSVVT